MCKIRLRRTKSPVSHLANLKRRRSPHLDTTRRGTKFPLLVGFWRGLALPPYPSLFRWTSCPPCNFFSTWEEVELDKNSIFEAWIFLILFQIAEQILTSKSSNVQIWTTKTEPKNQGSVFLFQIFRWTRCPAFNFVSDCPPCFNSATSSQVETKLRLRKIQFLEFEFFLNLFQIAEQIWS